MNDNNRNILNIDTSLQGTKASKGSSPSEIREARAAAQNSILNQKDSIINASASLDTTGVELRDLTKNIGDLIKSLQEAAKSNSTATDEQRALAQTLLGDIKNLEVVKILKESRNNFSNSAKVISDAMKKGNVKFEDAAKALDEFNLSKDLKDVLTKFLKQFNNGWDKINDNIRDNIEKGVTKGVQNAKEESSSRKTQTKVDLDAINKGNEKLSKAISTEIGKLGSNLRDMIQTLDIHSLAQKMAPSSKQLLQGELQTTYGLSKSEFNKFKRDLFDSVDTGHYTNEEILKAMEALNTTELGSTKTATKYFNDILRGQKVLGISAQTQQNLIKLGNITGRNELTFYQNQVAKYLNSDLGLNKKQLDELVNLNSNLQMQAADIGIATEEFEKMSLNESAAFERTNTGFGAKYTNAISSLLANTDTAAALLGMDSGELSGRLARGESFIDLLQRGQGSSAALNVLRNGTAEDQTRYYEHAKAAWGVDANTWSVLRVIAQQGTELNKNLKTATDASNSDAQEAMKSLEEKEFDSINGIQTTVNKIENWLSKNMDWQILQMISNVGTMIVTAISAAKIGGNIKEIMSGLLGKGEGTDAAAKALKAGGLKSWLSSSSLGAKTLGGTAMSNGMALTAGSSLLLGGVLGVKDAIGMQGSTGKGTGWDIARGLFLGTGSKEQTTGQQQGAIAGNTAKWGSIGMGVGTLIAPGVGTLVGGVIGAFAGGIAGMFGASMSNEKKAAEEQRQRDEAEAAQLRAIEKNTRDTAFQVSKNNVGMVYKYRGLSNSLYMSGTGGVGDTSSGLKYGVTSNYGPREPIKCENGHITSSFHGGTDFGAPWGAPLYSNVTGTVAGVGKDGAGANYVGVTGPDGYTHWYWHMAQPALVSVGQHVEQGQPVGYVGKTGNASGPHLHYTVTRPGHLDWWNAESTINSLPFATPSIFDGSASGYTTPALAEDSTATDSISGVLSTIRTKKITNKSTGDIATPIVNSIGDLKQTIIDLSNRTSRNEKIMNALVNRTMESPTI